MYKTYVYEALAGVQAGPYNDRLGRDVRVCTYIDGLYTPFLRSQFVYGHGSGDSDCHYWQ